MTWALRGALLLAVGCARTLQGEAVTGLQLRVTGEGRVCPGEWRELAVDAVLADGDVATSSGAGGGDVPWSEFELATRGGGRAEGGNLVVDPDPRVHDEPIEVRVRNRFHPEITATLKLPVHYACAFEAHF